jgi:hypothetical protein
MPEWHHAATGWLPQKGDSESHRIFSVRQPEKLKHIVNHGKNMVEWFSGSTDII